MPLFFSPPEWTGWRVVNTITYLAVENASNDSCRESPPFIWDGKQKEVCELPGRRASAYRGGYRISSPIRPNQGTSGRIAVCVLK